MNKRMSSDLRKSIDQIRSTRNPISSIIDVGEGQNLEEKLILEKNSNIILISVGEGKGDWRNVRQGSDFGFEGRNYLGNVGYL